MCWNTVSPFVQSGVDLGDDVLFPFCTVKPEQELGFVRGVLTDSQR